MVKWFTAVENSLNNIAACIYHYFCSCDQKFAILTLKRQS